MRENLLYKGEWNQCLLQCVNAITVFSNILTLLNGIIDIFWWLGIGKGRTCRSFPSGEQFNISILLSDAAQAQGCRSSGLTQTAAAQRLCCAMTIQGRDAFVSTVYP